MPFKENVCFVHIPKCAGSSLEKAMGITENISCGFGKQKLKDIDRDYVFQIQHLTYNQLKHFNILPYTCGFIFTFVRNPFDRMVSEFAWGGSWFPWREIYGHKKATEKGWKSFEEFLLFVEHHLKEYGNTDFSWCHFTPMYKFIRPEEAHFIGRVENFNDDLKRLNEKIPFELPFVHINKRRHKPYQQVYTKETANIVRQLYAEDFKTFNYDKIVVISHYNEDIEWVKELEIPYVVYTKGTPEQLKTEHEQVVRFGPNKCREATSFIKYIIDNYNTLPDNVCFIQSERISWHNDDLLDIIKRFKWGKYDYCNINHRNKYYRSGILLKDTTKATLPKYRNSGLHRAEIWDYFFTDLGPPPEEEEWYCYGCGQFVVKRQAIEKHPLSFYKHLYSQMMKCEIAKEHYTALIFEHMWFRIFGENVALEPKLNTDDFLN